MWNCCFNPFFNINNFNYYCFILYRKKVPNNVNIYLNEKDSAGQQRHLYFMNFNFNFSDWKKNRTFFVWIEQVVSRIMHPQNWCRLIFFVSHLSFLSHSESSINKKVKVCLQSLVHNGILDTEKIFGKIELMISMGSLTFNLVIAS